MDVIAHVCVHNEMSVVVLPGCPGSPRQNCLLGRLSSYEGNGFCFVLFCFVSCFVLLFCFVYHSSFSAINLDSQLSKCSRTSVVTHMSHYDPHHQHIPAASAQRRWLWPTCPTQADRSDRRLRRNRDPSPGAQALLLERAISLFFGVATSQPPP